MQRFVMLSFFGMTPAVFIHKPAQRLDFQVVFPRIFQPGTDE
jgi:hypothetical protein